MTYEEWLQFPDAFRVILAEVTPIKISSEVAETFYLATNNFITEPSDTPSNVIYLPILTGNPYFDRDVGDISDNRSKSGIGDLMAVNTGDLDYLITDYAWSDRLIKIYLGGADWARADFEEFFTGRMLSLLSHDDTTLRFVFRDSYAALDKDLLTEVIPASGEEEEDQPAPVAYGDLPYVRPAIRDTANRDLQVCDGNQPVVDVAVNCWLDGILNNSKISSKNNTTGIVRMTSVDKANLTNIALEVKGIDYGSHTLENYIRWLVEDRAGVSSSIIDDVALAALPSYDIGYYNSSKTNILDALDYALPGYWFYGFKRTGEFTAKVVTDPASGTSVKTIPQSKIVKDTFKLKVLDAPNHKVTIGFARNYYTGGLDEEAIEKRHKKRKYNGYLNSSADDAIAIYTKVDYRESVAEDSTVLDLYPDSAELGRLTCAISNRADADLESARILDLVKKQRYEVTFEVVSLGYDLEIGDVITVEFDRYGFDSGIKVFIIGLKEWFNTNVTRIRAWF